MALQVSHGSEHLGFTALHMAIIGLCGADLKVQLELNYRGINEPDSCGWTPLMWAWMRGDETSVRMLLDSKPSPR